MHSVVVSAPAKLNLTLDITGVRADGYHTVDMLMQSVSLFERVTLKKSGGLWITMSDTRIPVNETNTVYLAAREFFQETGLLAGAVIHVEKRVPVRAGMAGGSADAAAVLTGLNTLYEARLSRRELCAIGARVGADVPFCILGGTARVTGIGDELRAAPPCPRCWFTVCMPEAGVSTPQAYARYDEMGTDIRPDCEAAEAALRRGDLKGLCTQMKNALEFSSESEDTGTICGELRKQGALAALMTGSGAAVFGVFREERGARRAWRALNGKYAGCWVLRPIGNGARVIAVR